MKLSEYLETTTQDALAKAVGVTQGTVHQWVKGILPISAQRAADIERATGGLVTRIELRPDIFGPINNEQAAA
jgi:DNA-binding transcriptional regulator YdaS (Cro superfamily)